jgi:hypothetical protein
MPPRVAWVRPDKVVCSGKTRPDGPSDVRTRRSACCTGATVVRFGDGEEVIWRSGWFWLIVTIVLVLIDVCISRPQAWKGVTRR